MFSVLPSTVPRKALSFSFAWARCRFAFAVASFHEPDQPLRWGTLPGKGSGRGAGGELLPVMAVAGKQHGCQKKNRHQ